MRRIAIALLLVFLLSCSQAQAALEQTLYADAPIVPVYQSADTSAKQIRTYGYGQMVTVLSQGDEWSQVDAGKDSAGWCRTESLSWFDPNFVDPVTYYAQLEKVMVYSRPDGDSKVVETLRRDDAMSALCMLPGEDWLRVALSGGKTGYVAIQNVARHRFDEGQVVWCRDADVPVYSTAGGSCEVGRLYWAQPIRLVDAEGGWSEIHTVKGVTGWIRTDALTEADPNIYEETMYTQVSGSFLCEAPPESADPKPHKIGANTKVRIIARNGALCRVKYDGKCYYVPSQVLSPHKAGDGKSTRLSVGADVALHEDANLFSDSVGTVPAGSEVTLLGASHDAVKVRYAGSDGWVVDLDRLYAY